MLQGCVERYCRDGDPEAFSRLVTQYRPMVAGICHRYVIEPADVEDAVQETFVKLSRHAAEVTGDVGAWLAAVAGTTALDYARRALRERARRKNLALEDGKQEHASVASWRALEMRLQEALEGLDPAMRSLVMARFFTGEAVKELAKRSGVNSATMSRRVAKAVAKVRRALAAKGYGSLEETLLADDLDLAPIAAAARATSHPDAPGKIRIGVILSHQTSQLLLDGISGLPPAFNFHPAEKHQLQTSKNFHDPNHQLIALLEPGTEEYGYIDRGLRDFGITSGSIDITDIDALKTLDIIVLGHAYAVTTRVLDAVTAAVESGVGLYHEGQIGTEFPGSSHPKVCRLLLTDRMALYHTPGQHNQPRPATIVAAHPILAGVPVGSKLQIAGCGPVFAPIDPSAKVLMVRDDPVNPQDPPVQALNGLRMPTLMVGKIGRGRVAVVAMRWPQVMQALPGLRGNFVHNVFHWLAEERLIQRQFWTGNKPS